MKFLLSSLIIILLSKEFILLNEEFFIIISFFIVFFLLQTFVSSMINQELANKAIVLKQNFYEIFSLNFSYIVSLLQFYFFYVFWINFFFKNVTAYFLNINKIKIDLFYAFLDKVVDFYLFFVMEFYLNVYFNNLTNLYMSRIIDGVISSLRIEK